LPIRDLGGHQFIEHFLERGSIKLRPVVESDSFEFMRGYLSYEQGI